VSSAALTPPGGPDSFRASPPTPPRTPDLPLADPLKAQLQEALNRARKERDRLRILVLSTVLSEIRNEEIRARGEADDELVTTVLTRAVKQRREAAEQMRQGGREELALKEEDEARILGEFLPPALDEEEVRAMIREMLAAGADQMGAVMGRLMPRIKGRFDGKEANRLVREEMGG
jgi:uncharacterized protein